MATTITSDQWTTVRNALEETGERFAHMVSAAPDPHAKATGAWSVAETAAHVAAIAIVYTVMLSPDDTALPYPELEERIPATTVDTVDDLNEWVLGQFTERDPDRLAQQLRDCVGQMLRASADADPGQPVTWLGAAQVPVAGILAHLLNELQIHGGEIARATGTPWAVRPQEAALFFELFLIAMIRIDYGRLMDDTKKPRRDRRIAVEFRSDYTSPVTMVLDKGQVTIEEPGGATDVRVSFEPVTLNLMLFHRISKARAVLSGKISVRGRRPWLVFTFLRTVHVP